LGPETNNDGTNNSVPTGDFISYQDYAFSLSQPGAVIFQTALINPYSTYTTRVVNDMNGDTTKAPLILEWTLPSLNTPAISFTDGDQSRVANEPAFYDTSDLYSESFKFTRISTDVFKYSGNIIFYDPVTQDQLDAYTLNGEVSVTLEDGGLLVSDSDSFVLRGDTTSTGTPIGDEGLLVTGKGGSTSFVTGPIPEPATWSLMILGLGATGAALRRRPSRLAAGVGA
jgi:hypothetical protein